MSRWLLFISMLWAFIAAAPVRADTPPTYYFVFEADEARLAERADDGIDLDAAMQSALDVAAKRIGKVDHTLERIGERRVALTLTHENAPQAARDVFGITGDLDFLLVDLEPEQADLEQGKVPAGTFVLPHPDGHLLLAMRKAGGVSGDHLIDARAGKDPQTGQPVITLGFDPEGKEQFATLTRVSIGKPLAIVLDGKVLSVPTIQEPILEGQVQISGSFTQESAEQLAIALRSGALPTPFRLIEERRLEPVP